jgi:hypothetical protein
MEHKSFLLPLFIFMLLILLSACAVSEPSPTTTVILEVEPTLTSKVVVTIQSSPTAIIPTFTIAPTVEPTATFSPVRPVNQQDDIVGIWLIRILGGGEGDEAHFEFRDDGTWSITGISGYHEGMTFDWGTYHVEEGSLFLDSDYCYDPNSAVYDFYSCTAEYKVSVQEQFGYPVRIRFRVVEDYGGDRQLSLNGKTFSLVDQ